MAKVPGSIWVEGEDLHIVDQYSREWWYAGFYVKGAPGALAGSIYLNTTTHAIHWISASLIEYQIPPVIIRNAVSAVPGSIWIEDSKINWIAPSPLQKIAGHWDIAYDNSHLDVHTDTAHSDIAHSDGAHLDHLDNFHYDMHYDTPHQDHNDQYHGDGGHGDTAPHSDFADHGDGYPPLLGYGLVHTDGATQIIHYDWYSAGHTYHSDVTTATATYVPPHLDASNHGDAEHVDSPHQDGHGDSPHQDAPPVVSHGDHQDSSDHQDTAHGDIVHEDVEHTDTHQDSHGDSPHFDTPTLIGP